MQKKKKNRQQALSTSGDAIPQLLAQAAGSVGARWVHDAMARKRKKQCKPNPALTDEERKSIKKLTRFCSTMHRGMAMAETNTSTWADIVGATKTIRRITLLKSQDTLQIVKDLEKQTKKGPALEELSKEAVNDKVKIANSLIAQGMHWDKIEGALVRLQGLCQNEDEILQGPWEFLCPELHPPADTKDEEDHHET